VNYRSIIAALAAGIMMVGCSQNAGNEVSSSANAMPGISEVETASRGPNEKSTNITVYILNLNINTPTVSVYSQGGAKFVRTLALGEIGHFSENSYALAATRPGLLYTLSPTDPKRVTSPGVLNVYRDKGQKQITSVDLEKNYARLAVDEHGDAYTVCQKLVICEYTSGGQPLRQINTKNILGRDTPVALAVDRNGDLAVLGNSAFVYPPGSKKPTWRIPSTEEMNNSSEAFDPSGNLYIADFHGYVREYAPNSGTPSRIITQGIETPTQVLCDSSGNLYVLNTYTITVYAAGATSPNATITDGLNEPSAMALDSADNLYVANSSRSNATGTMTVYAAVTYSLLRTVTSGVETPRAIGVSP